MGNSTTEEDKQMLEWAVLETNKVLRKWKVSQDPKLQMTDNLKSVALNFLQRSIKHFSNRQDGNYRKWQVLVSGGKPTMFFNLDTPCVSGMHFAGPMYQFERSIPNMSAAWNTLAESLDYKALGSARDNPVEIDFESIRNIKF